MSDHEHTRVITLMGQFRAVTRLMVDELIVRLHAAGYTDITAAQHIVFENLDAEGTRLTTLATRAGITRQSLTELVTMLARNGYLELRPDPGDRRARLVRPTRKGRALIRRAIAEIELIEADWQGRFADAGLSIDLRALLSAVLGERSGRQYVRADP